MIEKILEKLNMIKKNNNQSLIPNELDYFNNLIVQRENKQYTFEEKYSNQEKHY